MVRETSVKMLLRKGVTFVMDALNFSLSYLAAVVIIV